MPRKYISMGNISCSNVSLLYAVAVAIFISAFPLPIFIKTMTTRGHTCATFNSYTVLNGNNFTCINFAGKYIRIVLFLGFELIGTVFFFT